MKFLPVIILLCLCFFLHAQETQAVFKNGNVPTWNNPPKIYGNFEEMAPVFHTNNDTTYVVNFWATWCKPCVEEMKYFIKLDKKFKKKKFKMFLVSLDFKHQIEKRLIPYILDNNIQAEVLVLSDPDANSWIPKIHSDWGGAIPATLIFTKNKRLFYQEPFENYRELKSFVKSIL